MTVFKPLALRVPHQFDEPPPYFAARLAARNSRPARMFTRDMGLDFVGLANGCDENIRNLANLGGCDYRSLLDCALRKTDGSIELKRQKLQRLSLRRARKYVCPACLLDDIASSDLPAHLAVHGRSNWMLSAIRTCHIHEVALVEVARGAPVHDTHDWTTSVTPIVPQLQQLQDSATHRPVSALELHLLDRLAGRPTASWLNEFPFFAAAHVSELIGAVAIFGKRVALDTLSEDSRYQAGHVGATIANTGPDGLTEFMETMIKQHVPKKGPPGDGPNATFGKLYTSPAHGLRNCAYHPLREVMGAFILKHFALGPGDELFGEPVVERQIHSVRSASLEYQCSAKRLRKILMAQGLLTDPKALDREILFDVKHAERIFKREQDSLTRKEAQTHLNAGQVQFGALLDADIIKRHHAGCGLNEYYRRSEIDPRGSVKIPRVWSLETPPLDNRGQRR